MGMNSEYADSPVVVDLETCPLDCAADYVPAPDLESIQAARNLKDPEKVIADILKRKAEAMAEHEQKLGKAALDFNLARIVAIGWSMDGDTVHVRTCASEDNERAVLSLFWAAMGHRPMLGYRIRTFDAPMLMARSRYLDVRFPLLDLGRYSRGGRVIDLWDTLTFGLSDYDCTTVMPRKLKSFARRFGLPVEDEVDGKDVAALVAAGEWEQVVAHVTSDVRLTAALARRVGLLRATAVEVF